MDALKKWLNKVFIEGLSGMATGLFATLIIGTIIQQIGSLIGGSIGSIIGMYKFHHKTKKNVFVFGMPMILVTQIVLILMYFGII